MTFEEWLQHGIAAGWVSGPACAMHDGVPSTPAEDALLDDGDDPCMVVLRLWPED